MSTFRLRITLIGLTALAALVILSLHPASASDDIPELLGPGTTLIPSQVDHLALRARSASLNLNLLEEAKTSINSTKSAAPIALTLFDDTRLIAHFNRVDQYSTGYTLAGTIEGSPYGEIHLSLVDGYLFASLNTHRGIFFVQSVENRTIQVIQVDISRLPKEADPIQPPAPAKLPGIDIEKPLPVPLVGATTTDDGSRIDVFVGYTDDARAHAGSTSAMQAMINTGISETNTGYSSSSISQRVNLVGTAEYSYDETSFNWDTTLGRWSGTSDTYMDSVHTTRNSLAADEVVLVVHNNAYCGMGYLMHSDDITPSWSTGGFALVSIDCLTGYYSLAHEMGHNMGAHHDRYSAGSAQGAYDYAYGFWIWIPADNKYTYRTIMAYDVPSSYGYDSTRVNRWSNPYISYAGQPTGKPTSDPASAYNALCLNNTAWAVARFRDGASPVGPGSLVVTGTSINSAFVDWTDVSGEWLYRIERKSYSGVTWSEVGQTAANVTSATNTNYHSTADYSYRVLSDNGNGRTSSPIVHLPSPPTNLTIADLSVSSVRLTWVDNSDAETGFSIERSLVSASSWSEVATTTTNDVSVDLSGISTLSEYKYRVRARNGTTGISMSSNTVNGLPARPNSTTVSQISMSRLRISWSDSSTIESGYRLERTLDGSGVWNYVTTLPSDTTTYDDADLPCNTHYGYRIRAYNSLGSSDWSTNSGVHTAACGIPPSPTPLTANPLARSVTLHWANVDGESGYRVYSCTSAACTTKTLISTRSINVTSYTVSGLNPNHTYYFGVAAYNAYGNNADPIPSVTTTTLDEVNNLFLPSILKED